MGIKNTQAKWGGPRTTTRSRRHQIGEELPRQKAERQQRRREQEQVNRALHVAQADGEYARQWIQRYVPLPPRGILAAVAMGATIVTRR